TAGHGPAGPWRSVFTGYGTTSITGSTTQLAVTLQPARTESRNVTHAALVVSASPYADFVATLRVRTVQQLRHGVAGSPNPWEVGWVVWHYTSNQHFYALTLEPAGWELSQQDPAYPGGERFLASGTTPVFRVGITHTVGIVQIGSRMTVSADERLLVRFADTKQPYLTGAFGFYSEDAQARFDHIRIFQLPAPAAGTRSDHHRPQKVTVQKGINVRWRFVSRITRARTPRPPPGAGSWSSTARGRRR
ncbi:MAG TPA: hypothetical protein VN961_15425, partial [Streptosporangiaceae bacterium]|nr:hypothetical protein [Streptosporangiaceae bacterium]